MEMPEPMDGGFPAIDCPRCAEQGKKNVALPMTICRNCGWYYLSDQRRFLHRNRNALGEATPPADVCPHCGTDRIQWIRNH